MESTFTGIARIDDLACLATATQGTEAVYRLVAPRTGPITVSLDGDAVLDVAVAPTLHDGCDLTRCTGAPATTSGARELTFDARADVTYYVIVDGPANVGASFSLTVRCP